VSILLSRRNSRPRIERLITGFPVQVAGGNPIDETMLSLELRRRFPGPHC
jgi:hypothetical protein